MGNAQTDELEVAFLPQPSGTIASTDSKLVTRKRNLQDVAVYLLLFGLGALQFALSCRATDFVGDVYYFELAKSIAARTGYGFNFKPETMLPPGFPFLLSLLISNVGSSYALLVRMMAIFTTGALIAAYELLRSQEGRGVAAATCLLLGSSPDLFQFSTRSLFSDMPYFFTTMLLLWSMTYLDAARKQKERTLWWLLCVALMFASVLIRSTGIALLGGILAWIAASFLGETEVGMRRSKIFLPLVVAGAIVLVGWMYWAAKNQFHEWPLHGYQEHYLAQLRMKNGADPELGLATWRDILVRPVHNADDTAAGLMTLVTRKSTVSTWYSPATLIPLALVILGLAHSFWKTPGGLLEWCFLIYQAMFLFWPWDFELRFLLPVAPLGLLYVWRGVVLLLRLARNHPGRVGAFGVVMAVLGCVSSVIWGAHISHPRAETCIAIWAIVGCIAIGLLRFGRDPRQTLFVLLEKPVSLGRRQTRRWQVIAGAVLAVLFTVGVAMQIKIGEANLHFRLEDDGFYPDIAAAKWISEHTPLSAVVMARKEDLVYHYGRRRVIWFPPTSNSRLLMDGIRRYHVQYIVVVDRPDNSWKPPVLECFQVLSRTYPGAFRLVHQGPHDEVFAVSSDANAGQTETQSQTYRKRDRAISLVRARGRKWMKGPDSSKNRRLDPRVLL